MQTNRHQYFFLSTLHREVKMLTKSWHVDKSRRWDCCKGGYVVGNENIVINLVGALVTHKRTQRKSTSFKETELAPDGAGTGLPKQHKKGLYFLPTFRYIVLVLVLETQFLGLNGRCSTTPTKCGGWYDAAYQRKQVASIAETGNATQTAHTLALFSHSSFSLFTDDKKSSMASSCTSTYCH